MHYMHDLKDLLCAELEDYAEKGKKSGKMSMGDLETVHKLTDTVKNIDKIEMLEDGGYSEDTDFVGEGRMYGTSYARGRGRNARRDSMGRYSRDDGMHYDGGSSYAMVGRGYSRDDAKEHMMEKAEEMLEMATDPKERRAIEKFMRELDD